MRRFALRTVAGTFSVCRLDASSAIPEWATGARFLSIARTAGELSIVCEHALVPASVKCEAGWRCFRLDGPIAFTEVGVLHSLLRPLALADIGVFAISTFDTDYVLVKECDEAAARAAWIAAGYEIG